MRDRLGEHARPEKGDLTGPNPVDRGKYGSKIHLITERSGLPISIGISGANLHDSQALIPLVKGVGEENPAPGQSAAVVTCEIHRVSAPHDVLVGVPRAGKQVDAVDMIVM
ncbi:hypothetical protein YUWDRAFT_06854 [Streptomyces sp. AmelKG-D3]|nr:hypothetical protein YUWDRAFT_06854 [Streptomyces sp. AmelKG-D3]